MKRSKMVETVFLVLVNCPPEELYETVADRIVQEIEELGMLPPVSTKVLDSGSFINDLDTCRWDAE